ncbi:MAG: sugar-transfer associated ATP-grasp domain-containing protein [Bacteroidota bacterium]
MWFKKQKLTEVLGINERNRSYIYPNNPKQYYQLADDKIKSKSILHENNIPCAETYAEIAKIGDIPRIWQNVTTKTSLAIKPSKGFGGGGIKILKKESKGNWLTNGHLITEQEIYAHMANIILGVYSLNGNDRVLIEACIEPHYFFHEIYPVGVPDFRIILLNATPVMGMLRMPTAKSNGKANLHQGGLGIGIDLAQGILKLGFDGKQYYNHHPDSHSIINGKKIPFWDEILNLSIMTSKYVPLNYLGVDIVIDAVKGPLIMEINIRPGLGIQQVNQTGLKKLLKQVG